MDYTIKGIIYIIKVALRENGCYIVKIGKSGLSYEQVKERYEHFRSRCTKSIKNGVKRKTLKKHKENGCTEPLYGEKSKGVLRIVPQSEKCESLEVDEKCIKFRGGNIV